VCSTCPSKWAALASLNLLWLGCHWWLIVSVFSFFSLSWQLKCLIVLCLFVVCLDMTAICQTQLGSNMAAKPNKLGFDIVVKPCQTQVCWVWLERHTQVSWVGHPSQTQQTWVLGLTWQPNKSLRFDITARLSRDLKHSLYF